MKKSSLRKVVRRVAMTTLLMASATSLISANHDGRDLSLQVPPVAAHPSILPHYNVEARKWQGIPGLERASNGRLWATWYSGGGGEGTHNYVVLVTSDNDGSSWSLPNLVIDPPGVIRAFDPCLWLDPVGRLWLFWAQSAVYTDGRDGVWAVVTENPGDAEPAWSEPRRLCDGVMMNKPSVLKNGEWMLPVSLWDHPRKAQTPEEYRHPRPENTGANVVVSVDQGKTWAYRGGVLIKGPRPHRSFDEHMLTENSGGILKMWIRTNQGIAESVSADGGKKWSEAKERSDISSVNSRFFIRRLKSGRLLMVANRSSENRRLRSHLTAWVSEDDGTSWKGGLLLDGRGDRSGVSYPDGVEGDDGLIRIIYDFDRNMTGQILMAVFTEADVLAGSWDSSGARSKVLISHLGNEPQQTLKK